MGSAAIGGTEAVAAVRGISAAARAGEVADATKYGLKLVWGIVKETWVHNTVERKNEQNKKPPM